MPRDDITQKDQDRAFFKGLLSLYGCHIQAALFPDDITFPSLLSNALLTIHGIVA